MTCKPPIGSLRVAEIPPRSRRGSSQLARSLILLLLGGCGEDALDMQMPGPDDPSMPSNPSDLALSSVHPQVWPSIGGTLMVLQGSGFHSAASVSVAGVPIAPPSEVDEELGTIRFTLPPSPGVLGPVPIKVTNPDGSSVARGDLFSFSATRSDIFGAPIPTGSAPSALRLIDLNSDGIRDAVITNSGSDNLSVLLGLPRGYFAPARQFAVGRQPKAMVVRDVDGDGKLDVVAACAGDDAVSVSLGDGAGAFGSPQLFPTGTGPTAIVAGDFNRDGSVDLITLHPAANALNLLRGDGRGSFGPPSVIAAAGGPSALVAADWNGDGKLDVATANFATSSVSAFLGDGAGNFAAPQSFAVGTQPSGLAAGDVNGDGIQDLISANTGARSISFLAGDGTGRFAAARNTAGTGRINLVTIADLTRDGKADVLVARPGDNVIPQSVLVYSGDGAGNFTSLGQYIAGEAVTGLEAADLDGDGPLDLATVDSKNNLLRFLWGSETPQLGPVRTYAIGVSPADVDAGDLNGDGITDLVTTNTTSSDFSILLGRGGFRFESARSLPSGTPIVSTRLADLDRDGKIDIISYHATVGITIFPGLGDGQFDAPRRIPVPGQSLMGLAIGDMNEDGLPDMVIGAGNTSTVGILFGEPGGQISQPQYYDAGGSVSAIELVDLNEDRHLDVLVFTASSLQYIQGQGRGTLAPPVAIPLYRGYQSGGIVADFNRDGHQDVALVSRTVLNTPPVVEVLLGNGKGALTSALAFVSPPSLLNLEAADFNVDGALDLIISTRDSSGLAHICLGDNTGRFVFERSFMVGANLNGLLSVDFNRDRRPDLVVINLSGMNGLSIVENESK